jgi:hypothetical protein
MGCRLDNAPGVSEGMTSIRSPMALEFARQVLARDTANLEQPAAVATAMQRTIDRLSNNLRRSVGDDGYNALLARVLRATEPDHAVLLDIRRATDSDIRLDGIVTSVERHGVQVVSAAIEAALATLADVLAGLVGADMVPSLLDHNGSSSQPTNEKETR